MKCKLCLYLLLINLLFTGLLYGQGNLAQAGANFLQIDAEPRGMALGGATTAIASGAAALYWNPAGAIHAENMEFSLAHTNWFLDTKLMYGAFVKNLGKDIGALGISITSFYMDPMEITTVYESEGTGEFYDAGDLALGLSYSRRLTDRFVFGLTAKYVRQQIWNETASQVGFDVGSLYRTDFLNLRIGMVIRNFGGKLKFEGEDVEARIKEELEREQENNPRIERLTPDYRMPQIFQMGIAFEPFDLGDNSLVCLTDVYVPSDNVERVTVGVEYGFMGLAYLRGAYRINHDIGDLSVGGGLRVQLGQMEAVVDYGFSTFGPLGNIHQFGFGFAL